LKKTVEKLKKLLEPKTKNEIKPIAKTKMTEKQTKKLIELTFREKIPNSELEDKVLKQKIGFTMKSSLLRTIPDSNTDRNLKVIGNMELKQILSKSTKADISSTNTETSHKSSTGLLTKQTDDSKTEMKSITIIPTFGRSFSRS